MLTVTLDFDNPDYNPEVHLGTGPYGMQLLGV